MQDINNSRSDEMRRRMVLLRENNLCLFCQEGFNLLEKTKLFECKHWYVTINDAPYAGATTHVMAVPHRHIADPEELTADELHELFQVVIPWLRKELGMQGLSGIFRFGRTQRTGATIHHLHFHFVEGVDRVDLHHPPVWAVVGFKPDYTPTEQPT
jgi:diadenosine tetraphosphate (Ap4A) HIT family hydrolase